jgi:hypothetical protein
MVIYSQQLEHDGFVVVPDVVNGGHCEALADRVQALRSDSAGIAGVARSGVVCGVRQFAGRVRRSIRAMAHIE